MSPWNILDWLGRFLQATNSIKALEKSITTYGQQGQETGLEKKLKTSEVQILGYFYLL